MQIGQRIEKFTRECYHTQTYFAECIGITISSLNRYIKGKYTPKFDMLLKFFDAGMSIDWLLNGSGSMYANNEKGREFKKKYKSTENNYSNTPFGRAKQWIMENYGTLKEFAILINMNYDELNDIFNSTLIPDPSFLDLMSRAGCSINWLATGEGSEYENNPLGMLLKLKEKGFDLKSTENEITDENLYKNMKNDPRIDFIKLIRLAIKAEFIEREREKI